MKFAVITHVLHKRVENEIYAYEPYVREMNLWFKYVNSVRVVAPQEFSAHTEIDEKYVAHEISVDDIPSFNILSLKQKLKSLISIPVILYKIYKAMKWADHIHLRCPGNVGLLGCFVQILFPSKPKTVKYAGNWDPNSKIQPLSYRLQKWLLSNTFFTKNCQVLVYGQWEKQTKNIKPFFTASYSKNEIEELPKKELASSLNFIFVGGLTPGKQPLLSVQVVEKLAKEKKDVRLDIFGDGTERPVLEKYIGENNLASIVKLHGNVNKKTIKEAFKSAHFLLFVSKSEGWPKVVAEAMFWGVLPITSRVSCVPYMIDNGNRGTLVESTVEDMLLGIDAYIKGKKDYIAQSKNAAIWSQKYTLEKFESEIAKLLNG